MNGGIVNSVKYTCNDYSKPYSKVVILVRYLEFKCVSTVVVQSFTDGEVFIKCWTQISVHGDYSKKLQS